MEWMFLFFLSLFWMVSKLFKKYLFDCKNVILITERFLSNILQMLIGNVKQRTESPLYTESVKDENIIIFLLFIYFLSLQK
jgi:hypothetical protein